MAPETRFERARGEAMRAFLRRFRHEISTPLSAVNLHLEVALRRMQKPGGFDMAAVVENLRTCRQSLESATAMLELIAEAAREESDDPTELSLLDSLSKAVVPLREEARSRGLILDVPGAGTRPRWFGSARELEGVFAELTRNAIEYSSPPGTIRWSLEERPGETGLVCRSPGRLPPGDPEHLFGVAKGAASAGQGFGLPRARLAIESNGGELTLRQEGEDVCASLRFPTREE